jgi:hypothetical protein
MLFHFLDELGLLLLQRHAQRALAVLVLLGLTYFFVRIPNQPQPLLAHFFIPLVSQLYDSVWERLVFRLEVQGRLVHQLLGQHPLRREPA